MITWNITDARLEERLVEHNDGFFPIEDMMAIPGSDRERYLRSRRISYKAAQGWETARHGSFTKTHGAPQRGWRAAIFTSAEKPIAELARAANMERQHGEALRLIDVPAVFEGHGDIFDQHAPAARASAHSRTDVFAKIAAACLTNHGEAFEKYVASLIAHGPTLETYVDARSAYFIRHVCDEFDGDVARDVAATFGLIYAAGMLGIRYELLPWNKAKLLDAIAKCYFGARNLLPDEGLALRQGLKSLRASLRGLPSRRKLRKPDFRRAIGYRKPCADVTRCIIRVEAFNAIFASDSQKALVIQWLIQQQRITLAISSFGRVAGT